MDRLTAMEVFTRVVERGSFTAAAEELRLSRAMVSRHMQELEDHLGARLLNRTTRRVGLTELGRSYYERCVQILADIAEAEQTIGDLQTMPRGRLRVNAPMSFGTMHLAAAVTDFTTLHRGVVVDMTMNDRVVDLIEEGYDLAIRIGKLADSSLIARRLAPCRMVVCASPHYLDVHGRPEHPQDLMRHNCLGYTYWAMRWEWRFEAPGGPISVRISGNMEANNGEALRVAALRGHGIIMQPSFIVGEDLAAGRLEPLLGDYRAPELSIFGVYPSGRHLSAKVRSFLDFLAARYGDRPYWDTWIR